jgi:hypothetical protein
VLEVHPPHHAASSWRDFFIHIATIVIGLLIAIGLEQLSSVSISTTSCARPAKSSSRAQGQRKGMGRFECDWRRTFVELKNNLTVLARWLSRNVRQSNHVLGN